MEVNEFSEYEDTVKQKQYGKVVPSEWYGNEAVSMYDDSEEYGKDYNNGGGYATNDEMQRTFVQPERFDDLIIIPYSLKISSDLIF